MLKYDQNLVKDFLKRGDELNLKNCKHVEDIELLYRKDHKHLTQYKQRLVSDLKYDVTNLVEFVKDSQRVVNFNAKNNDRFEKLIDFSQ